MITLIKYPNRTRPLLLAVLFSLAVHIVGYVVVRTAPIFGLAVGLRGIQFVDEDFDRSILITFNKKFTYPPGYAGFRPPERTLSLEEIKKLEARRRAREEARRARQHAQEERERAAIEAATQAEAESLAKAEPTPTPKPKTDGYGAFGKINTAPIKAQIQRLYDAKQEGKLALPEGRLKVGVKGSVRPNGTLDDYRVYISSGTPEIDEAALAILDAVSASRALGPLHEVTSLTIVLDIDQIANLTVTGFVANEQAAANIVNLANAAILVGKIQKADEPAAKLMLDNLKVFRTGKRVQAVINVPRQVASEMLAKTMAPK
jgi:hypothetical protein